MNKLQKFSCSEFGELGILEIDGKPYFPATKCARMIGHQNPQRAVRKYCKNVKEIHGDQIGHHPVSEGEGSAERGRDRGVVKYDILTEGGRQAVNFIPEGDLYRLIVHSRLPAAERFEKWVFEEVLPSIRQNGGYAPDMAQMIREEVRRAMQEVISETVRAAKADTVRKHSRRHGRKTGIIANLDAPIRQEIDLMLESRKYTYHDICQTLERDYGIRVSKSALGRYAQQEEEPQEPSYPVRGMYPRPEDVGMLIRLLMPR